MVGNSYGKTGYKPTYYLFPDVPYCNCKSVMRQVVRGEKIFCKHFLALNIAISLGKVEIIEKSKDDFTKIIKRIQSI